MALIAMIILPIIWPLLKTDFSIIFDRNAIKITLVTVSRLYKDAEIKFKLINTIKELVISKRVGIKYIEIPTGNFDD